MPFNVTPVTNHRGREKGMIVYPVYSRRSAGLSIGINLFPGKKCCQFDCPYCEVFPFYSNADFFPEQMEEDLRCTISSAQEQNIPIKDICFSGNGEPTFSPVFAGAFRLAETIRAKTAPSSQLVVITNGAGLLQAQTFSFLRESSGNPSLNIWLKLDAGTEQWYQKMNRSQVSYEKLIMSIKEFTSIAPVTIQTMLCVVENKSPPAEEEKAWEELVCTLAEKGKIRKVQIYGKARAAPEDPLASALPENYLEKRASSLRSLFIEKGITTPVEVYL
ncbi:MAG: hypothetical protein FWC19_03700 [Treponema sp.]|nr:hypothetical protein [Treponema sp.]MCL2271895.1 hypothetical protein [Treponema sp.]